MEGQLRERVERLLAKEPESLSLDGARLNAFPEQLGQLLAERRELRALSLANCRLRSLAGLPRQPGLRELNLSDNLLGDAELPALLRLEGLSYLMLSGNRLQSPAALLALAPLVRLKVLFVEGCPVAESPGLRARLFEAFPALRHVDGFDRDGAEGSYVESDEADSAEQSEVSGEDDFIDDGQAAQDAPGQPEADAVRESSGEASLSPRADSTSGDDFAAAKPTKKVNQ